ncbi:glucose PTS transporter transcription antiterminator GlcT [Alkalihalobacterium chitinilyticum]|uniref:PRD domain-containing protein n=1 Tax=Alkalihalobacterium chitinilyticum TaxID=2980103 RepID=A0ABT5VAB0_9BACI|nr:PRD domain-containing protein [Alkalihalobacterium chitinilyticum]MDE5412389.1 PRD domain-containing protein [Alkalihalobacterium chitinilyticum]
MRGTYKIKKVLNNNVVIALNTINEEMIIIGKGLGFGKKQGDLIDQQNIDQLFQLVNEQQQEEYKQLLLQIDDSIMETINDAIVLISRRLDQKLNEHIHIALTDHIAFAIRRLEQGIVITNPFLTETKSMYPVEFQIAEQVINLINQQLEISLPKDEIGFVTLHIHSALENKPLSEIKDDALLLKKLINLIETGLKVQIEKNSLQYSRLVIHLRHVLDRVLHHETVELNEKFVTLLKQEYPLCYNLAWKLIKIIQTHYQLPVADAEAVYLAMHLQRLTQK